VVRGSKFNCDPEDPDNIDSFLSEVTATLFECLKCKDGSFEDISNLFHISRGLFEHPNKIV
jgi:hypothetical protein